MIEWAKDNRLYLFQLLPVALVGAGFLAWAAARTLPDAWVDAGMLGAFGAWVAFGNAAAWNADKRAWRRSATALGGVLFLVVVAWQLWPLNEPF